MMEFGLILGFMNSLGYIFAIYAIKESRGDRNDPRVTIIRMKSVLISTFISLIVTIISQTVIACNNLPLSWIDSLLVSHLHC